jgi:hypothetical protein
MLITLAALFLLLYFQTVVVELELVVMDLSE